MTRFRLFYLGVITVALTVGCSTSQNMTGSTKYEDDEVYYRKGEHFITEATNASSTASDSQNTVNNGATEEDYYSGESNDEGTVNNYYGDVIQNYDSNGNGISNRYARFVFDPFYGGWRLGYGYSSAWNNWYSPYYNSWYYYYMDPWVSNNYGYWGYGWGNCRPSFYFNNYYMGAGLYYPHFGGSPYSPYAMIWGYNYNGWYGNNNVYDNGNSIVFGHRPSYSTNSNYNSGYTFGTINSRRKADAQPATNPTRPGDNTSSVNGAPNGGKGRGNGSNTDSDYNSGNNSTKPNRDSGNNRPSDNSNVDRGSRGNSSPNVNPSRGGGNINRGNGGSSPSRNGGTSPSRGGGSSPSRGSGGGSAPSRGGGGGRR